MEGGWYEKGRGLNSLITERTVFRHLVARGLPASAFFQSHIEEGIVILHRIIGVEAAKGCRQFKGGITLFFPVLLRTLLPWQGEEC